MSDLSQNTRKVIQFSARMASLKDSHIITTCFRNLEEWSNRVNEGAKVHLIDEDNIFGEAHNEVMSVLKDYKPAIEKL